MSRNYLASIPLYTPWAKAAGRVLRSIAEKGFPAAIARELHDPGLPKDPDWCRTITALATDQEPPRPERHSALYDFPGSDETWVRRKGETRARCEDCNDRGIQHRIDDKGQWLGFRCQSVECCQRRVEMAAENDKGKTTRWKR